MRPRSDRETFFRSKSVVLTERDELAYSRVLREFCPGVLIAGNEYRKDQKRSGWVPNIPHGDSDQAFIMVPSPGQEDRWHLNAEMDMIVIRPRCQFYLRRSSWEWSDPTKKWAFDLPLLGWGGVVVGFPRDDPEIKKFCMKLLRLVNKVTWNRKSYGLDACRWSQAGGKERRGLGSGILIDPKEKIELNKYYDDTLWDDDLPTESTMKHDRWHY